MPLKIRNRDNKEYTDPKSKFYIKNFISMPRDAITLQFQKVFKNEYYQQTLPPLIKTTMLPNFREKEKLDFKRTPYFDKLIAGDYEQGRSNYDTTNVRVNIEFFMNNLPSFMEEDKNDLSWVVNRHRLLSLEIFQYYKDNEPSLSTLEARFNTILRIIRIAYKTKEIPLYKLFSTIVFQLHQYVNKNEGRNKLNKYEQKKYIHWEDVRTVQGLLEKKFNDFPNKKTKEAYDTNNELLLLSMYSLIPPLRNEIKDMQFTFTSKRLDKKKDYIHLDKKNQTIILRFYRIKKQHHPIDIDLVRGIYKMNRHVVKMKDTTDSIHLAKLIKESYELYPRLHTFTLKFSYPNTKKKASQRALDERLIHIFNKYGIYNKISVNSLRSSYASYILSRRETDYNDKENLAFQMRTSVECLERSYNKVLTNEPLLQNDLCDKCDECNNEDEEDDNSIAEQSIKSEDSDVINIHQQMQDSIASDTSNNSPQERLTPYEQKLEANKKYYREKREEILQKQKEYKSKKTPFEKTRERTVQMLNASPDYANIIKKTTIDKYKIYFNEDSGRWTWYNV